MDNKYQRGKIYKIISPNTDKIYIGSTIEETLARRLRSHRQHYRVWKAGKNDYASSFEIIAFGKESIILVELFPCNSKDELRAREQHHIDLNIGICVNQRKAYQPPGGNRLREAERKKQIIDCPVCGVSITRSHVAKHQRTKTHQDYLAGIPCDPTESHNCPCGGRYTKANSAIHQRTKRHQDYLAGIKADELAEVSFCK